MFILDGNNIKCCLRSNPNKIYTAKILDCNYGSYIADTYCLNGGKLYPNDYLLQLAGFKDKLAQKDLFLKIFGYWLGDEAAFGNYWPWCKSTEDVIKLLNLLYGDVDICFIDPYFLI